MQRVPLVVGLGPILCLVKDRGFAVVAVSLDTGPRSAVEAFVRELGLTFPVLTATIGLAAASPLGLPAARAASWRRGADAPTRRSEVAFQGRLYALAGGPTPGGSASGVVETLEP
jgi:hypothetical protein